MGNVLQTGFIIEKYTTESISNDGIYRGMGIYNLFI